MVEELGNLSCLIASGKSFWESERWKLARIMHIHVEDLCYGNNDHFHRRLFGGEELRIFEYRGVNVRKEKDVVRINQNDYVRRKWFSPMN